MAESDDTTAPVGTWDLTGTQCPRTFVLAKVALERIEPGQMLEIVLLAGEQMQEVPRALKAEGHRVEQVLRDRDRYRLLVRRGGGRAADAASGRGIR
jgi:tRNA 2-thiouridine synthesizing protein A